MLIVEKTELLYILNLVVYVTIGNNGYVVNLESQNTLPESLTKSKRQH